MNEKACLVTGISSYEKDGKTNTTVHLLGQFKEFEKKGGALGFKAFSEWTRLDVGHLRVGDVVRLYYDKGFQDKAQLEDIVVLRDVKNTPFADFVIPVFSTENPFTNEADTADAGKKGKNA